MPFGQDFEEFFTSNWLGSKQFTIDFLESTLPDWATGLNQQGELKYMTQLQTRDGREIGNARIQEVQPVSFLVKTDLGTTLVLSESEIRELFYIGPYFLKD